jgi:hypothetical protein
MTPLFKKLNLGAHRDILVRGAPDSFESALDALDGVTVRREVGRAPAGPFALIFVRTLAEVEAAATLLPKFAGDAVVWFAYPKASSKRYRCDFNRDTGWAAVGGAGFEPVRQVAIDEDWSALRFRRTEYVKKMTRDASRVLSPAGKARARKTAPPAKRNAGPGRPRAGR